VVEGVRVVEAVERLVDEAIALVVVVAAILMVALGLEVPEWFYLAFGVIIGYYFRAAVEAHRARGEGGS